MPALLDAHQCSLLQHRSVDICKIRTFSFDTPFEKPDRIYSIDQLRISGIDPSSVILSQTKYNKH